MTFSPRMQNYRESSAVFDGPYRYRLDRAWLPIGQCALVVMLNPSMADADRDDHTIRRLRQRLGDANYSGFTGVNFFARIATRPASLASLGMTQIVGPWNDAYIAKAVWEHATLLAAWGNPPPFLAEPAKGRVRWLLGLARGRGISLSCFGTTRSGHPRHPSRLPRSARLEAWLP